MKTTSIEPCGHNLVVDPVEVKNETESGIIITVEGSQMERLEKAGRMIGTIVALGSQCWLAHAAALIDVGDEKQLGPWAKVGDCVLYSRHAGKFTFDPLSGVEFYVIHDEDVLCKYPPQSEWKVDILDLTH